MIWCHKCDINLNEILSINIGDEEKPEYKKFE